MQLIYSGLDQTVLDRVNYPALDLDGGYLESSHDGIVAQLIANMFSRELSKCNQTNLPRQFVLFKAELGDCCGIRRLTNKGQVLRVRMRVEYLQQRKYRLVLQQTNCFQLQKLLKIEALWHSDGHYNSPDGVLA